MPLITLAQHLNRRQKIMSEWYHFWSHLSFAFNIFTSKRDCSRIYRSLPNATLVENSGVPTLKQRYGYHNPRKHARSLSLIRFFTGPILDSKECKFSSCGQRRLIRLGGCAGWSESSSGAHVRRYVFSRCGSYHFVCKVIIQSNLNSSNTDCSFTIGNTNSFLNPY